MREWAVIFFLCLCPLNAQEYAPFKGFDSANTPAYQQEKKKWANHTDLLEKNRELIKLAYAFKDYEGLIDGLEKEIKVHPKKAELYYSLAGIQGIRSLEVSKIFAPPYLRGMIQNFEKALQLSPQFIPAIEAYIEVLCKIPSLFGGSKEKAKEWVEFLKKISPLDGALAEAFFIRETQGFSAAIPIYQSVFEQLQTEAFCDAPAVFLQEKSINYPYKIAEMVVLTSSSPEVGLCAINYYIEKASLYYNLPMEWAYYRKGQLLKRQGEDVLAKSMFKKALEINPKFEKVKKELF